MYDITSESLRNRLRGHLPGRLRSRSVARGTEPHPSQRSLAILRPNSQNIPPTTHAEGTFSNEAFGGEFQNNGTERSDRTDQAIRSTHPVSIAAPCPDLWSAAYCEAVESLQGQIDITILEGRNIDHLFRELEQNDNAVSRESAFRRGVKYLHSIRVPLERLKLALDLASPLTSGDPTTSTVFGMIRGVTALAISLASADLEFAQMIGEMLEHIAYIDDCDTLGQKVQKSDIHRALVSIYRKLLEFYEVATDILKRSGLKLSFSLIRQNKRLPDIVQDFLKAADMLQKLVQKATLEIVRDIEEMYYNQEIGRCLGSSEIKQQSEHQTRLRDARSNEACQFFLASTEFKNWYSSIESQQLIILGEMGCGKSMMMAFLIDELSRRSGYQIPQPKMCYYYCRRQSERNGQTTRVFSGLILSLLEQLPGLKKKFCEWYRELKAPDNLQPATNIKSLEELLRRVVIDIDRPVYLIVDGLDECDRASRYVLLRTLKALSQVVSRLKVLLSSRPEKDSLVLMDGMPQVYLSSDTQRDCAIAKTIVERQLYYLAADARALIIEKVSSKAQGCAVWTSMIIELIGVRQVRALNSLRILLEELPLPGQLAQLYDDLVEQYASKDDQNMEICSAALRLLSAVRRPLSILELGWAVALSTSREKATTIFELGNLVDYERVIALIHPFIARLDFDDLNKRQVQLMHQSIRDYVVKAWMNQPDRSSSTTTRKNQEALDDLDRRLESSSLRNALLSVEQQLITEMPQEANVFDETGETLINSEPYCTWETFESNLARYNPAERGFGEFFVYASCHWIDHFGAFSVESFSQLSDLEKLCQAGSTRLDNWVQQNRRPDCTIQPRFEFDSTLYDALSITALYGSEITFQAMLENSNFEGGGFVENSILEATKQVLQWGDLSRLELLLHCILDRQLNVREFFRLILERWSSTPTKSNAWDEVFGLVNQTVEIMVREGWANYLLCKAVSLGCLPLVTYLLTGAQHNGELLGQLFRGAESDDERNPLRIAIRHGDFGMCEIILRTGQISSLSALTRHDDGNLVLRDRVYGTRGGSDEILGLLLANMALQVELPGTGIARP